MQASSNTSTSKILHSIALNLVTIITKIISMILKWMFFKLSLLPVHSFIFSKCVNTYRHLNTNFWKYLNYVHGCMSHHKKIKIRYNSFNRKWLGYYMNIISIPTSATGAPDVPVQLEIRSPRRSIVMFSFKAVRRSASKHYSGFITSSSIAFIILIWRWTLFRLLSSCNIYVVVLFASVVASRSTST